MARRWRRKAASPRTRAPGEPAAARHYLRRCLVSPGPPTFIWNSAATADGWSDGRYGNYDTSPVVINDYLLIRELSRIDPEERLRRLNELGDADARLLGTTIRAALHGHKAVVVLTHAPAFAEAAWQEGNQSGDDWLPHFSSKASGDV